ncbi:hypothetical protein WR25_03374 [Diploscapter pachys]|uniref:Prokaryotic-type class I peptide chain release factors domain-containing protein n=1 Tax=Diploscapter pachys TaxID=2018661 RepID=A0A2A2LLN0_9BILA|nr:hypothetical protein WR25_03374 [Diploscapter pachys]
MLFYRCNLITVSLRYISVKQKLKGYRFPEIRKEDCEQKFISGWGPGGQKVNKAENAVQLRHIPTGIVLKIKNIEIAYERMKFAVDRHLNGDDCYEEQYRRMQKEKEAKANEQRRKHREEKMKLKEGNSEDEDKANDKVS